MVSPTSFYAREKLLFLTAGWPSLSWKWVCGTAARTKCDQGLRFAMGPGGHAWDILEKIQPLVSCVSGWTKKHRTQRVKTCEKVMTVESFFASDFYRNAPIISITHFWNRREWLAMKVPCVNLILIHLSQSTSCHRFSSFCFGCFTSGVNFFSPAAARDTLPETNSILAPENGWLEDDRFLLGPGLFSGANLLLVSGGSVFKIHCTVWPWKCSVNSSRLTLKAMISV